MKINLIAAIVTATTLTTFEKAKAQYAVGVPIDNRIGDAQVNQSRRADVFANPNRKESVIVYPEFAFVRSGTNILIEEAIQGNIARLSIKLSRNDSVEQSF